MDSASLSSSSSASHSSALPPGQLTLDDVVRSRDVFSASKQPSTSAVDNVRSLISPHLSRRAARDLKSANNLLDMEADLLASGFAQEDVHSIATPKKVRAKNEKGGSSHSIKLLLPPTAKPNSSCSASPGQPCSANGAGEQRMRSLLKQFQDKLSDAQALQPPRPDKRSRADDSSEAACKRAKCADEEEHFDAELDLTTRAESFVDAFNSSQAFEEDSGALGDDFAEFTDADPYECTGEDEEAEEDAQLNI